MKKIKKEYGITLVALVITIIILLILIIIIKPVKKNNEDIYSKYLYPNGKDYLLRR